MNPITTTHVFDSRKSFSLGNFLSKYKPSQKVVKVVSVLALVVFAYIAVILTLHIFRKKDTLLIEDAIKKWGVDKKEIPAKETPMVADSTAEKIKSSAAEKITGSTVEEIEGSTAVGLGSKPEEIQLHVTTTILGKAPFSLNIDPNVTVKMLKKKISESQGMEVEDISLSYLGMHLDDKRSLAEYSIVDGTSINLSRKLLAD